MNIEKDQPALAGVRTPEARILVIDDEASVADALKMILLDSGYEVAVALNGREGLAAAAGCHFDVTITDLRLPDMSGLDVLRRLRAENPAGPIIVITAHSTPEMVGDLLRAGALDVLPKPFYPDDVLSLIREALGAAQRRRC